MMSPSERSKYYSDKAKLRKVKRGGWNDPEVQRKIALRREANRAKDKDKNQRQTIQPMDKNS